MDTRRIVWISMFAALGAGLRIAKHMIVGPLQFVNFPYVVAALSLISGLNVTSAFMVGTLTFIASDVLIGVGPWTLTNSVSLLTALLLLHPFKNVKDKVMLGVVLYLSVFIYDFTSSVLGYLVFLGAQNLNVALYLSLIGLFLPVSGGGLFFIGPTTELITVFTVLAVIRPFKRLNGVVGIEKF